MPQKAVAKILNASKRKKINLKFKKEQNPLFSSAVHMLLTSPVSRNTEFAETEYKYRKGSWPRWPRSDSTGPDGTRLGDVTLSI